MVGDIMAGIELSKDKELYFVVPQECGTGIYKIAGKVMQDVYGTTMAKTELLQSTVSCEQAVIAVTAGKGTMAQQLVQKYPELQQVEGKRESYGFYLMDHPLDGIENGLVIIGSDKLGTIYGLFHLSELLGVTPLLFWGDKGYDSYKKVYLKTKRAAEEKEETEKHVYIENGISKEPSVKYRGFFINDEWPCFGSWTVSHYEGFTADMYDHVFEYLLRMKGNYLWPAMWTSSFLLDGPGMASMELADAYGIYIGMSHHEPCMRSSEEWDLLRGEDTPYGTDWSYITNKEGLLKYWEDGLKRSEGHSVFPTIGMRGERDSKLLGEEADVSENVRLLKDVLVEQRALIEKHLEKDGQKVPKLFAVYKEVEDYYFGDGSTEGLRVFEALDDVTLLLCDDNFGNMRALPEARERNRKGGFGMYFHLDYHGEPISYEWVTSTPLTKIWEQMTEAYEYGIRELWIVNVGDLKFQEYPLNYFMELAYDFERLGSSARNEVGMYTDKWIKQQFGSYMKDTMQQKVKRVLDGYIRLNGLRRPEALNDTIYHPAHYMESMKMLERCKQIEQMNQELLDALKKIGKEQCYYSTIYFPAAASVNLLKMHLYSGLNHLYASQGKAVANIMGEKMEECIALDEKLAKEWTEFKDGKWKGMEMASHIGFVNWNDEDWRYPVRHVVRLPEKPRLVVSRADETRSYTNQYFPKPIEVYDFCEYGVEQVVIQIANGGQGRLQWEIESECQWLNLSCLSGTTELQDEIVLTVQKENMQAGKQMEGSFRVCAGKEFVPIHVRAIKRDWTEVPLDVFLPQKQMYVIDAAHYSKKMPGTFEGQPAVFEEIENFGKYGSGMKVYPVTASFSKCEQAPALSYQIWVEESKEYRLALHTSPANPLIYGGKLHYVVKVKGKKEQLLVVTGDGYKGGEPGCVAWEEAVLNQEHVCSISTFLEKGCNEITVYAQEAGIVLERLIIYPKETNKKESYLGPEESVRKNKEVIA